MKICSLSSGSKGNCLFVESGDARVLVDAGISARQIARRLDTIGVDPSSIDAIVLTHAHNDHVRGAGVFARKYKPPIYGHPETLDQITYFLRREETVVPWTESFTIKDLSFVPFEIPHDAYPTVGYTISQNGRRLVVCTDLGVVTNRVKEVLKQADLLLIESNHDPDMLMNGPYPWELKERIASRVGHLSNHDTGELLKAVLSSKTQRILLAHLSEINNSPEVARETVLKYIGYQHEDILEVLEQRKISPIFEL